MKISHVGVLYHTTPNNQMDHDDDPMLITPRDSGYHDRSDEEEERDDALIPCDICYQVVRAHEYEAHARICSLRHTMPLFMMVRDEDDNTVYRLNIGVAFDAMDAIMRSMNAGSMTSAGAVVAMPSAHGDDEDAEGNEGGEDEDEGEENEDDEDGRVEPEIPVARTHAAFPRMVLHALSSAVDLDGMFAQIPADFMGRVYVGLSKAQLAQVLTKQSDPVYCTICCEDVQADVSTQTLCRHNFCEPCITKWLGMSKKCPMCMVDFEDELERRANVLEHQSKNSSNVINT